MAQQLINLGTVPNDRTGTKWRGGGTIINANFTELYGGFASRIVVINSESDFDIQDASTITLETNIIYFINTAITTAKGFIVNPGATLQSTGLAAVMLAYTGIGVMFTSTGGWRLEDILYTCANGQMISATGAGQFVVFRDAVAVAVKDCGSFTDVGPVFDVAAMQNVTGQGFTFSGTITGLSLMTYNHTTSSATHVAMDLGTAVFNDLLISNCGFDGPAGSTALKGLTAGGNIASGRIGSVTDSDLSGDAMAALDTINENDVRWAFRDNRLQMNTRNAADAVLTTLETVTIASSGVFVEVDGGNWTSTIQDRFTTSSGGVVTYNGDVDIEVKISGFATVAKVGGGADEIEVRIAKNWVPTDSGVEGSGGTTENASATSVPIEDLILLTSGDDVRMITANNDSTANIEVSIAKIIITEA